MWNYHKRWICPSDSSNHTSALMGWGGGLGTLLASDEMMATMGLTGLVVTVVPCWGLNVRIMHVSPEK